MTTGIRSLNLVSGAQACKQKRNAQPSRKLRATQVWFAVVSTVLITLLALTGCGNLNNSENRATEASAPGATCTEFNSPSGYQGCACPVGQQPFVDQRTNTLSCGAPQANWNVPQGCGHNAHWNGPVVYGYVYGHGAAVFPYQNGQYGYDACYGNNWNQGAYCQIGLHNSCGFNMYCRALNNGSLLGVCSF